MLCLWLCCLCTNAVQSPFSPCESKSNKSMVSFEWFQKNNHVLATCDWANFLALGALEDLICSRSYTYSYLSYQRWRASRVLTVHYQQTYRRPLWRKLPVISLLSEKLVVLFLEQFIRCEWTLTFTPQKISYIQNRFTNDPWRSWG